MAKAGFNIENFIATVKPKDLARSHRYEVMFQAPAILSEFGNWSELSLYTEDTTIPGTLVGTTPLRLNNQNYQRATAIDYMGDSIVFTFLVDTSWETKNIFTEWMEAIVNPMNREIAYPADYYSTIIIHALDGDNNVVAGWKLHDAFPRSVAPVAMSYGNTQVVRLPVTMTYRKWTKETV